MEKKLWPYVEKVRVHQNMLDFFFLNGAEPPFTARGGRGHSNFFFLVGMHMCGPDFRTWGACARNCRETESKGLVSGLPAKTEV